MSMKPLKKMTEVSDRYRVVDGSKFRLKDFDPDDTAGLKFEKKQAQELLQQGVEQLSELQDRLYAQDRWAVLLVFQAMDAAGKDSTIKHVMSGVNPQGTQVYSFKAPSSEELDHDFMWRCHRVIPERGRIGIFNRSYYEEVLVVRVHPEFLQAQKLPTDCLGKHIWKERFKDIVNFEDYLGRNGVAVCKFFLNVSKEEQKKRFLQRLDQPEKNWKFSPDDVKERQHWDDYHEAYEDMIRHTATKAAPWYVVPADHKWFTRLVVGAAVTSVMGKLNLEYPKIRPAERQRLEEARKLLESE